MDGQTSDRAREGRKRRMSSHFRPFLPSFLSSFFCIFSHCCGVLLSRNTTKGRKWLTWGLSIFHLPQPSFPPLSRFLTLLKVKPPNAPKSERPLGVLFQCFLPLILSRLLRSSPTPSVSTIWHKCTISRTGARTDGPSTTPLEDRRIERHRIQKVRFLPSPHFSLPLRVPYPKPPYTLPTPAPARTPDNLVSCRRFGNCYFCRGGGGTTLTSIPSYEISPSTR